AVREIAVACCDLFAQKITHSMNLILDGSKSVGPVGCDKFAERFHHATRLLQVEKRQAPTRDLCNPGMMQSELGTRTSPCAGVDATMKRSSQSVLSRGAQ